MAAPPRIRAATSGRQLATRRLVVAGTLAATTAWAAPRFYSQLQAFRAIDAQAPSPAGALLFVGSSTIRLWPDLALTFAPHPVVQRGFGGATLAEVVNYRELLFGPHRPGAVVLYAGENDIAESASPAMVIARWLELRAALSGTPAGRAPWVFIGLKPSPRRWPLWPSMRAVNDGIAGLAPGRRPEALAFPADWLLDDNGGPPDRHRYFTDGLHFNGRGYAHLASCVAHHVARLTGAEVRSPAPAIPASASCVRQPR